MLRWVAVLALLAGPALAETCDVVPMADAVAQIYDRLADSPDREELVDLRISDLSGDGVPDLLYVTRYVTEGGAGDAASVFYGCGQPQGVCARALDVNLDAAAGPVKISAAPTASCYPDLTIRYDRNERQEDAEGITDRAVPTLARFGYAPDEFGYVELETGDATVTPHD